jgi:hypothetical protein
MAVYVDKIETYPISFVAKPARKYGTKWCHLYADSVEELHAFAESIGLKRGWFQDKTLPHYDLTPFMRDKALESGAVFDEKHLNFIRVMREKRERDAKNKE